MGFRINTNVAALSAHANASMNNRAIDNSLNKLNSGFRINSAADDASGMAIADSLRSQASSLGQAIMNANDAIGIVQTADKAMDEQIKILDTIKNKAIQSAQDGQTTETRRSLQADISRLMEELDNIGNTTSFNGQKLLSGTFSNKEFQIGAYSNETVKASIGATTSDKIGLTRFETGHNVRASDLTSTANFTFKNVDGINDVTFEPVKLVDGKGDIKAGMGLGALAEAINKATDKTGVKASVTVETVFEQPIKAGTTTAGFSINGVMIGSIDVKEKDGNGALRSAINSVKDQTGVEASVDSRGRLVLNNRDGRGIKVEDNVTLRKPATDKHELVTTGGIGEKNSKKGIDLNLKETWTTPANQKDSILIKENSFSDVRMAHGVQDSIIYKDGLDKAKELLSEKTQIAQAKPKPAPMVEKEAIDTFNEAAKAELDTLKAAMKTALTTFINALAETHTDATTEAINKKMSDLAANSLMKVLDDDKATIKDLSEAYNAFMNDTNVATQSTALDAFKADTALTAAFETYSKNISDASVEIITTGLKDADIREGDAKTLTEAATALAKGSVIAKPTTLAGTELDTINSALSTFQNAVKDIGKMDVEPLEPEEEVKIDGLDLSTLKPAANGAINLLDPAYQTLADFNTAEAGALNILKSDLETSLKQVIDAASTPDNKQAKDALNLATNQLIKDIKGATSSREIYSLLNNYKNSGVDFAANETDMADVSTVFTAIETNLKTYLSSVNEAATAAKEKITDLNSTAGDTIKAELIKIEDATTALNTALEVPDGSLFSSADVSAFFSSDFPANKSAMTKAAGAMGEVLDKFSELQKQTTINGVNAAIDEINRKLETVINNASGKTMDTDEAKNGMYAHAMKQFLAGVKAGLNEPNAEGMANIVGLNAENSTNFGRLSLSSTNGRDIQVEVKDANGYTTNSTVGYDKNVAEKTVSLRETNGTIDRETADAMGFNSNDWQAGDRGDNVNGYAAGVMTLKGAQAMMNIAEAAQKALEAIRSDLGSVQNQLVVTVNNISVTQVNVKAAESNIRDVDFAQESATFSKHQILAQSGVYAMSQANAVQQNVMRLLQ